MWTSVQGTIDASTDVRTCWVVSAAAALRGTFNTTSGTSAWVSVVQYSFSNHLSNQPSKQIWIIKTKKCKTTTWKVSVNVEIVNCTFVDNNYLTVIYQIILAPCKYHSKIFLKLKWSDFKKPTKKCVFQICNLIVYYNVYC